MLKTKPRKIMTSKKKVGRPKLKKSVDDLMSEFRAQAHRNEDKIKAIDLAEDQIRAVYKEMNSEL